MKEFDSSMSYVDILGCIDEIKDYYKGVIASFYYFESHERVLFIRHFKRKIYSLNFEYWKINKIWEYINDWLTIDDLKKFI